MTYKTGENNLLPLFLINLYILFVYGNNNIYILRRYALLSCVNSLTRTADREC